jgi:hypothetical protein
MTNEELARRAVASKRWRWMRGTRLLDGRMIIKGQDGNNNNGCVYFAGDRQHTRVADIDGLPDLDDPATLGCLEARVLETYGSRSLMFDAYCGWDPPMGDMRGTWRIRRDLHGTIASGRFAPGENLKVSGLIAALEVAP